MGKILTPRQMQAILKPCPTVAHIDSDALVRRIHDYRTVLYVGPIDDRLCWSASVTKMADDHPLEIVLLSPAGVKEMETLCREMLYLKEPTGQSVGKGTHHLLPGRFAVNLIREMTDDERALLADDWLKQPTDKQIAEGRQ